MNFRLQRAGNRRTLRKREKGTNQTAGAIINLKTGFRGDEDGRRPKTERSACLGRPGKPASVVHNLRNARAARRRSCSPRSRRRSRRAPRPLDRPLSMPPRDVDAYKDAGGGQTVMRCDGVSGGVRRKQQRRTWRSGVRPYVCAAAAPVRAYVKCANRRRLYAKVTRVPIREHTRIFACNYCYFFFYIYLLLLQSCRRHCPPRTK